MIEWYNENENRGYPVLGDVTGNLPYNFLVDLSVVLPASEADSAYLSSLTVTPLLVSISIASASGGLLVGTFPNTGLAGVPQALSPVVPNASGYVAFGTGINASTGNFSFADATEAGLDSHVVRPYDPLPVSSIGKLNTSATQILQGAIQLVAGSNVNIFEEDGKIIVELAESVRAAFVGPCDQSAAFITCGRPPLREINGVGPDETDGKIIIEVE